MLRLEMNPVKGTVYFFNGGTDCKVYGEIEGFYLISISGPICQLRDLKFLKNIGKEMFCLCSKNKVVPSKKDIPSIFDSMGICKSKQNMKDVIMPKLSIKSIEKEEKKLTIVKKGTVFSHPYDYSKADMTLPEMKRAYVGRTSEGGLICMDTIEKKLFIEENKIPLEIDLPIIAGVESMEGKKAFKKYIDFGNEPFDLVNSYEEVYFIKSNFKIDFTFSCNGTYLNTSFDTNEIIDKEKNTFTSALAALSYLVEKVSFLLMAKKYGYYKFSNKKAVKDAKDFIQDYLLFVNDEIEGIDDLPKKLRKELMRFNNE